jgi:hypothetical protein
MPQQEIIWTVLPNGVSGAGANAKLRLSVFVSPRLRLDGSEAVPTLDAFEDFRNWPARLASGGLAIDLIVDDGTAAPAPAAIVTTPAPDPALWTALLGPATPVTSHQPGLGGEHFVSTYPTAPIASTISTGYNAAGEQSPYSPADNDTLKRAFPPLHRAIAPGRSQRRGRDLRSDARDLADRDLASAHRRLSDTLLRHDDAMGFAKKLSAARSIAGRRVRAGRKKRQGMVPLILEGDGAASAFAQFAAFHRRAAPGSARAPRARRAEPVKDFHEILTSLSEYPDLLRRLGLVIDLEIDAARIPSSSAGELRRLRAKPRIAGVPEPQLKTPATKYLFSLTGDSSLPLPLFCAAPRGSDGRPDGSRVEDSEIVAGLLNLGLVRPDDPLGQAPQFGLMQIDLDGAGLKLLNAFDAIVDGDTSGQPIARHDAGAPTLRSSGLSLVRARLSQQLTSDIERADELEASLNDSGGPVLFAEDLVRGYRIDVRRFDPDFQFGRRGSTSRVAWHSLHKRQGTVVVPRPAATPLQFPLVDEGFIQPAVTRDGDDAPEDGDGGPGRPAQTLYVSESVFNWVGWSLSAPPPATPLDTAQQGGGNQNPQASRPRIHFEPVPKSLPRLRFGHYYQLRARAVDLAGNSLTVEQADAALRALEDGHRQQPIFPLRADGFFYRRFDPIPPPALVLREELTVGEAPDVMVIRSSDGLSSEAYAATLGDPKYTGVNERHIVPPKAAQRMTELHGAYEGAFGDRGDPAAFYGICAKEGGTLEDTAVVNVATGEPDPLPDRVHPQTGASIPFGLTFVTPPGGSGSYAVHHEELVKVPYLPDPLARGAALFRLPGVEGQTGVLADGAEEIDWSGPQVLPTAAQRALGFVTKIGYGDDWPGRLPFRLLLTDVASDAPQPLPEWDPDGRVLTVRLPPGETVTATISSYPGTRDIELFGLYAWWSDHVGSSTERREFLNTAEHGALAMMTPGRKVTLVHAVQKPVRLAPVSPAGPLAVRRFPNDTSAYFGGAFRIHGPSTAKLDLLAQWEEPGERGGDPVPAHVHVLDVPIHPQGVSEVDAAAASEKPIATYAALHADTLTFLVAPNAAQAARYRAKHDFGDTKYRKVTYTLKATSRYPEYFPARIASDADLITRSITMEEQILSSAAPAAPAIAQVVPIRKREEVFDLSELVGISGGSGFRVFLGSTWHSSGAGEQLALVGPIRWGLDPIHSHTAGEAAARLQPSAPGVDVGGVTVHAYPIEHDAERGYYADVTFESGGAYAPFVELTLARVQLNSIERMHLSPRVNAGIHQLPAARDVELRYPVPAAGDPGRRINIAVIGSRPSAAAAPPAARGYRIEVTLEERVTRDDPDLGWSAAPAGQPLADAPPIARTLWSGHVFVRPHQGHEQRIVIREFELFEVNEDPPGQAWLGQADATTGFSRRMSYAETIQLF